MQAEAARLQGKIDELYRLQGKIDGVYVETRTEGIEAAYLDLKAEQGGLSAVSIGELLQRTGLPKEALHSFLLEQARAGNADLHRTTLITLSAEDREGALPIPGSTEPAITVTMRPEAFKRVPERVVSIDKSDIIKEYDRVVKSPEARKELEKQNSGLVAARDQAIVEQKREHLQQKLAARSARQSKRDISSRPHRLL